MTWKMMFLCFSKCSWLRMLQKKGNSLEGLEICKEKLQRLTFTISFVAMLSLMALFLPLYAFSFVPALWVSGIHTLSTHTHTHTYKDTYTHTHISSATKHSPEELDHAKSFLLLIKGDEFWMLIIFSRSEREEETWEFWSTREWNDKKL